MRYYNTPFHNKFRAFTRWCLSLTAMLFAVSLFATHNRAGEITIRQIGDCNDLTIEVLITTYTKASNTQVDRDSLEIIWGDGTIEKIPRINGPNNKGEILTNDVKRNYYIGRHQYPARGTYKIASVDPNRIADILNVNYPNSVSIPFYLETTYTFLNCQFQGSNSTPILTFPPIDEGCVGQPFYHNPGASDIDDDSIAYDFFIPLQDSASQVPNYQWPYQISAGPNNNLRINKRTGDIVWDAPQRAGDYNLAIIIVSFRNGVAIDTTIRDMQILIRNNCNNKPPVIESIDEICVIAGDTVRFNVTATDPDVNDKLQLTAYGGPLDQPGNPAVFTAPGGFNPQPVSGEFIWATTCNDIAKDPYSIIFRALDNAFADTFGLAFLKTVRIRVVGPPPQDVQAVADRNQMTISWEHPYACQDAPDSYFRGFTVWRRVGSNPFPQDTCSPGLDGKGYVRINLNYVTLDDLVDGRFQYIDPDVEQGRTYCYRILAEFARRSDGGFAFNRVFSLPSDEICVQLNRDIPIITNVSVLETSTTNGQIEIRWVKPLANSLDTIRNPGPYKYEVWRATGITSSGFQPVPGASFTSATFAGANDTVFVDNNLNTEGTPYTYQIAFYVAGQAEPLGITSTASSIFLNVRGTDRRNVLNWQVEVPWINYLYTVYRRNDQNVFEPIGQTTETTFEDAPLDNGTEYCYYIESTGTYGVEDLPDPLINLSQIACGVPRDDVPPCPPVLKVDNICSKAIPSTPESAFENTLHWTHPFQICPERADDVAGFRIYFANTENDPLQFLEETSDTLFEHMPSEFGIAGCYYVTAVDQLGNESAPSDTICVDNCPVYELPNTFTPNGDRQNDLFKPTQQRFIASVEMVIYNNWGEVVYRTNDPDINWNGQNLSGQDLAEATYYYTCRIFEQRVTGITPGPAVLSGFIQLIRGR